MSRNTLLLLALVVLFVVGGAYQAHTDTQDNRARVTAVQH